MNPFIKLMLATLVGCAAQIAVAQSVQLSYPIDRSVIQRNSNDQATVTIAGQVTGGSSNVYTYQLYYRTSVLDAGGNATSTTGWSNLSMQQTGLYYQHQYLVKAGMAWIWVFIIPSPTQL